VVETNPVLGMMHNRPMPPVTIGAITIMLGYSNQPFIIDTFEVFTVQPVAPVPEPASLALFATGMVRFVAQRLRTRTRRLR
jgi:PEP-CTERM motif